MTHKEVLPDKDLLEKVAALKTLEISLLGKELKAQTSAAEKQYQKSNKLFMADDKKVRTSNN